MKHPKVDVPVIPSYSPLQISDHISYRIRKKGVFYMKYTAKTDLTKRALSDSLKKLVLNRPISKITIKDITDGCGLNRQTFYYHFQDIFEFDLPQGDCPNNRGRGLRSRVSSGIH